MSSSVCEVPLSRTCQNCVKAKLKCHRDGSPACSRFEEPSLCLWHLFKRLTHHRCLRLNKACMFLPARRRNNHTRKDRRIEALETKVRELLGVDRTASRSRSHSHPSPRPSASLSHQESAASDMSPAEPPRIASTVVQHQFVSSESYTSSASGSTYEEVNDPLEMGFLTSETAETLILKYVSEMAPHFPFIVIPKRAQTEHLRHQRPFLFLTMLTAASSDHPALQSDLGQLVKQVVASRMILHRTLSFDLFQGLLVYLAW